MSDIVDIIVALLVVSIVNGLVVRRIKKTLPGEEGAFLARVYLWTLALRFALALFLNINAGQSGFAAMF